MDVAEWMATGEAFRNYLDEFKDAFRHDILAKTKSEVGLNTYGVSGHGEVNIEDQSVETDPITVPRERHAQNASKRRSQFVYSLAIAPTATVDQGIAALKVCDDIANWKCAWRDKQRFSYFDDASLPEKASGPYINEPDFGPTGKHSLAVACKLLGEGDILFVFCTISGNVDVVKREVKQLEDVYTKLKLTELHLGLHQEKSAHLIAKVFALT